MRLRGDVAAVERLGDVVPRLEQRVLVLLLEPVGGALDRPGEARRQAQARVAPARAVDDLAGNVPPVNDLQLRHNASRIAASSAGTISPMPV